MIAHRGRPAWLLPAVVLILSGCGGTDGRVGVSGTVTLDGQPAAEGAVNFQPAPGQSGNSAGSAVQNGKFEVPADKGLRPGKYVVTFQLFQHTGRKEKDPMTGTITDQVLPVDLGPGASQEVTIADGSKELSFQLTTSQGSGLKK